MGILSKSPTMPKQSGMSRAQTTAVGSGSRPTKSKIVIKTSAPTDPLGLGRRPPGALK